MNGDVSRKVEVKRECEVGVMCVRKSDIERSLS